MKSSLICVVKNPNAQLKWEGKQVFGGANVVQHLQVLDFYITVEPNRIHSVEPTIS